MRIHTSPSVNSPLVNILLQATNIFIPRSYFLWIMVAPACLTKKGSALIHTAKTLHFWMVKRLLRHSASFSSKNSGNKMVMRWVKDFEVVSRIQAEFRYLRLLSFIWFISPDLKWGCHYFLAHITFSKIYTLKLMRRSINAKQWESCGLTQWQLLAFTLRIPFFRSCTIIMIQSVCT